MSVLDGVLGSMTLRQKVRQVLMATYLSDTVDAVIDTCAPGSLLFWGHTAPKFERGPREMADLANSLQRRCIDRTGRPVWVHGFIDAATMGWHGGWQASLAGVASTEEVERTGAVFGRRWRACGLHNFPGPTLNVPAHDTCIAKSCAMTGGASVVSRYGAAITRGVFSAVCGTMAQHFPAHGATPVDSHTGFPVVDLPRDRLLCEHTRPYQSAFDAGCTSICTAHVACTALDPEPDHIATTSRAILTEFLRGELGFKGIVIADAIGMKGFQKNGPPEAMSVEAVLAGCDSICITSPEPLQRGVFESILKAVRTGYLPVERLDDAVRRNLRFAEWLGLFDDPFADPDGAEAVFNNADDEALLADLDARLPQSIRARRAPATSG